MPLLVVRENSRARSVEVLPYRASASFSLNQTALKLHPIEETSTVTSVNSLARHRLLARCHPSVDSASPGQFIQNVLVTDQSLTMSSPTSHQRVTTDRTLRELLTLPTLKISFLVSHARGLSPINRTPRCRNRSAIL